MRTLTLPGCIDSLRSTSGGHLNIQGPNTRFPLSGSSKRQGCVSHSTPEAEIVAADVAMRSMGMPALKLVEPDSQEVTELCVL